MKEKGNQVVVLHGLWVMWAGREGRAVVVLMKERGTGIVLRGLRP